MSQYQLPLGSHIQSYQIRSVLGEGGFAITYKAWDSVLEQWFAIKEYLPLNWVARNPDAPGVVPRADLADAAQRFAEGRQRFLAEARLLARFQSPHIVQVKEFLELNGTAYLVMPFEEGERLESYLQRVKVLPEAELRSVLLPLLHALKEVHQAGWLHGDVSPANILLRQGLSPSGAAKGPLLLDFGSAQAIWGQSQNLEAIWGQSQNLENGTAPLRMVSDGYAAIEQYQSEQSLGAFTDIYALGATLYQCIAGHQPVSASQRHACLCDGKPDPLPALESVAAGRYTQSLLATIDAMLTMQADQRPQTINELLQQLGEPVEASPIKTRVLAEADKGFAPVETPPPVRGRHFSGVVIGLVLVAVLIGVGGSLYQRHLSQAEALTFTMTDSTADPTADTLADSKSNPMAETLTNPPSAAGQPSVGQRPISTVSKTAQVPAGFIAIPAGRYQMGMPQGQSDAQPVHWVSIKTFYLAQYPLTREKFASFVAATAYQTDAERHAGGQAGCYAYRQAGEFSWQLKATWRNPGFSQADNEPVVCVSWHDAQAYVTWLSATTGLPFRLPSEAEWEYAARGGRARDDGQMLTATRLCEFANIADYTASRQLGNEDAAPCDDGYAFTSPVGMLRANPLGVHDLFGNVWEWNADCWNASYQGAPKDGAAWLSGDCQRRILRGGSWSASVDRIGAGVRGSAPSSFRSSSHGFRLALDLD